MVGNFFKTVSFLLFVSIKILAQQAGDTIFFDSGWERTTIKDSIHYYRVIDKIKGNIFYVKDYYLSGVLQMTGSYIESSTREENRVGEFIFYRESGKVSSVMFYNDNHQKEGKEQWYYESGELRGEKEYVNEKYHGFFKTYYKNGKLKRSDKYVNGEWKSGTCYSEKKKKIKYYDYEVEAKFPGGLGKLNEFLAKNIKYPDELVKAGLEAKIIIRFVLDEEGIIINAKAVNEEKYHPLFVKEALRVIRKVPRWEPGKVDGDPVKSYFTMPITFKLT